MAEMSFVRRNPDGVGNTEILRLVCDSQPGGWLLHMQEPCTSTPPPSPPRFAVYKSCGGDISPAPFCVMTGGMWVPLCQVPIISDASCLPSCLTHRKLTGSSYREGVEQEKLIKTGFLEYKLFLRPQEAHLTFSLHPAQHGRAGIIPILIDRNQRRGAGC